jgi:hypothetical protein
MEKVTFETKKAMIQFLLNGGQVRIYGSSAFSYNECYVVPFRFGSQVSDCTWEVYNQTFEVLSWPYTPKTDPNVQLIKES